MSTTRRIAALTTAALTASLAATGLGVVAASPASAAEDVFFDWQISQQFTDHLSVREVADGAAEGEGGVISFPVASSDIDAATGAGSVSYDGSVAGSFAIAGVTYYTVTLADPTVSVDEAGEGEISALVSAWNAAAMGSPEDSTDPARVVVTTFDADGGWSDGSVTATPDWAGVLPPGAESEALGIDEGEPVDGQSFAASFLGQLTSGVRAHFYASGSGSDPKKAPATFTAEAQTGPVVATETAYAGRAVTIDVSGSGFTAVTEPGDAGVYVGLAPAGGLPDTDSQEDMDQFADAEWVMPAQMTDGTFEVTLDPANADLDPRQDYAVYTWQAHSHSNPSQDTETPVAIDFSKLGTATKLQAAKKGKKLVVTVGKGAQGKVAVKYTRGKATKKSSAKVTKGKAGVALPKKPTGKWKAVVSYTPATADYQAAKKKVTVRVR